MLLRGRVATPVGDDGGALAAIAGLALRAEGALGGAAVPVDVGIAGGLLPATGLVEGTNSTVQIGRPLQQNLERVRGAAWLWR